MKLSNLKIAPKLGILVGVTLFGLCISGVLAAYLMKQEMVDARIDQAKAIVEMARNYAVALKKRVDAGEMTKDAAMAELRRYGNAMVLGFNTGSSTQAVDDRVVSKVGSGAVSGAVVVNSSAGPLSDSGCNSSEHPGVCRWGDYAGASPDPSSDTTQSQGVVWLTNAYSVPHTGSFSDFRTWNWTVRPAPK